MPPALQVLTLKIEIIMLFKKQLISLFSGVKPVKKIFPCIIMVSMFFLTTCSKQFKASIIDSHSKSFFAMDTYMTITAYGENAETALNQAEERVTELEKLWSVTDENSEIYAINHSGGEKIPTDEKISEKNSPTTMLPTINRNLFRLSLSSARSIANFFMSVFAAASIASAISSLVLLPD